MTHTNEQERADFEAVARKEWKWPGEFFWRHSETGEYTREPAIPAWRSWQAARRVQVVGMSYSQIREILLAHGFTIKDGLTDLKPYVYEAARALLAAAPRPPEGSQATFQTEDGLMPGNLTTKPETYTVHKQLEELQAKVVRIGLDIDRAMRGDVNEQSPIANRLRMIASKMNPMGKRRAPLPR